MQAWLRKWAGRRLLSLNAADIACVTSAARQLGVGTPGGAEALAIFHQAVHHLWQSGQMQRPLARIKVDLKNCFGSLEWPSVRQAALQHLPRHHGVLCWKHGTESTVHIPGAAPQPKDRGAEQGDVDGPLECALTLADVMADARQAIHRAQTQGSLPWAIPGEEAAKQAREHHELRQVRQAEWSSTSPQDRRDASTNSIRTCPLHETQELGGIADEHYLDDGDMLVLPELVLPMLQALAAANEKVGATLNTRKTEVVYYATTPQLQQHRQLWRLDEVRDLATITFAGNGGLTLGVATDPSLP